MPGGLLCSAMKGAVVDTGFQVDWLAVRGDGGMEVIDALTPRTIPGGWPITATPALEPVLLLLGW